MASGHHDKSECLMSQDSLPFFILISVRCRLEDAQRRTCRATPTASSDILHVPIHSVP